jgi:hypothetical protein
MNTENLQRIKDLNYAARALAGFHDKMAELRKDSANDKLGAAFNSDSRFRAFTFSGGFDSWCGRYGNSSCSSVLRVEGKLLEPVFTKALNIHQRELFATMAVLLREEAAGLTGKARAEVAALQQMIAELEPAEDQAEAA